VSGTPSIGVRLQCGCGFDTIDAGTLAVLELVRTNHPAVQQRSRRTST
jgi:hypothetical protein